MKQYDYLIVGAGLFGAVFAQQATKAGKSCLVIDKRDHIAGNIYTENVEGINVHRYGAHIFHTNNKEVWDYVNQFAVFNRYTNSPVANYKGELYNLPFNMNTFNKMWGVVTPAEAEAKIEEQRAAHFTAEPKNLEEQAINLVGTDIYEKLVKHYTEKQWGRPCTELPAFIIKRLPVRLIFDNNYFNALYQGIPNGGYTQMVDVVVYSLIPTIASTACTFIALAPAVPAYAAALAVMLVVYVIVATRMYQRILPLSAETAKAQNRLSGVLSDAVTNILAVKTCGREDFEKNLFPRV